MGGAALGDALTGAGSFLGGFSNVLLQRQAQQDRRQEILSQQAFQERLSREDQGFRERMQKSAQAAERDNMILKGTQDLDMLASRYGMEEKTQKSLDEFRAELRRRERPEEEAAQIRMAEKAEDIRVGGRLREQREGMPIRLDEAREMAGIQGRQQRLTMREEAKLRVQAAIEERKALLADDIVGREASRARMLGEIQTELEGIGLKKRAEIEREGLTDRLAEAEAMAGIKGRAELETQFGLAQFAPEKVDDTLAAMLLPLAGLGQDKDTGQLIAIDGDLDTALDKYAELRAEADAIPSGEKTRLFAGAIRDAMAGKTPQERTEIFRRAVGEGLAGGGVARSPWARVMAKRQEQQNRTPKSLDDLSASRAWLNEPPTAERLFARREDSPIGQKAETDLMQQGEAVLFSAVEDLAKKLRRPVRMRDLMDANRALTPDGRELLAALRRKTLMPDLPFWRMTKPFQRPKFAWDQRTGKFFLDHSYFGVGN